MVPSAKPVRKCHACPLNLGDRCWHFATPRDQWRAGRRCAGFDNATLQAEFRLWQKRPQVKTRKELRRENSGARKRSSVLGEQRPKRGDKH